MKRTFESIAKEIDKNILIDLYEKQLLSLKAISKQLNICSSTLLKLIDLYDLNRDEHAVKSKSNSEVKQRLYRKIKANITYETLYNYYITEDHGYYETIEHFNISEWLFDRLLKDYDIKKDRSKSFEKGLQKRIETYGADNLNNWKQGQQTRIENSGDLKTSYEKGYKKQVQTMLEKYGVECPFSLDEFNAKKKHTGPNEQFARLLNLNNIRYEREVILNKKSYDFAVGNTLIEINPLVTHNINFNPFNSDRNYGGISKTYHKEKSDLATSKGYRCIHVWPWDDLDKIIKLLKNRPTVYARNCTIKEVPLGEAKKFIEENHIQGYIKAKVKIGLYYNNVLVSIMTFGKPRFSKKAEWELIRYCSSYNVIGGAEKIFKHFVDSYNPISIISYCDNSKFTGSTYLKLNFKLLNKGQPTRHWCNLKLEHYLDSTIRKKGFSRIIHHCSAEEDNLDTNDNYTLMRREKFLEVFDCGQSSYIWKKETLI